MHSLTQLNNSLVPQNQNSLLVRGQDIANNQYWLNVPFHAFIYGRYQTLNCQHTFTSNTTRFPNRSANPNQIK